MIRENYSLLTYNTFGIEATACRFVEYHSENELIAFLQGDTIAAPYLHIGGGSNLLFLEKFYPGTVFHSCIKGIEIVEETGSEVYVRVGAGVTWDDFVAYSVSQRWYGAENLSHIPGEVGASAIQNIGAYGVEAKDLITKVETVNIRGEKIVFLVDECGYGYRNSIFKGEERKDLFVTYVTYRLNKQEHYTLEYGNIRKQLDRYLELTLENVRKAVIAIRESKLPDPKQWGNGGSFFMNPVVSRERFQEICARYPDMPFYEVGEEKIKIPAGWMIEQCGWKGKSLGAAGVYEKQALVLVNLGGATGEDILRLSDAIRASIQQEFGLDLHPEVCMIGLAGK
ncbi:MAG: UDP-N-acetylmuramate dehydrogenase [Bacteroides sp.]|nr:UDP-N-acetylmuramate dehydrogenase [Bacteroides sp.]